MYRISGASGTESWNFFTAGIKIVLGQGRGKKALPPNPCSSLSLSIHQVTINGLKEKNLHFNVCFAGSKVNRLDRKIFMSSRNTCRPMGMLRKKNFFLNFKYSPGSNKSLLDILHALFICISIYARPKFTLVRDRLIKKTILFTISTCLLIWSNLYIFSAVFKR